MTPHFSNPNSPSNLLRDMNPATIENLNPELSPQTPSQTRRLKVVLPQCYAALAIFALNLSHAIFEHTLYRDKNYVNIAIDAYGLITVLGLLFGGVVAQITGPRAIIRLTGAVSIVGWITLGWINSKEILHWTIYIVALAAGMMQAPCFVYLAEISQPNMRSALMATTCVMRNFGSFYLNLRDLGSIGIIAFANLLLALFGLVLMFILPESPYWLANKGHCHETESSLAWFRGRTSVENVKSESQAIINNAQTSPTAFQLFWRKSLYIRALIVGYVFIATVPIRIFFTINYHYRIIWTNLDELTYKVYLVTCIITVLLSVALVVLIATIGKRLLILISLYFGSIALLIASIFGYLNENNIISENLYSWFLLICLALAYFSIILGIVPIPLILNGELFPSKLRNLGVGFGLVFGHVVQMISNKVYSKYFRYTHGPELALALISMIGFISLFWLFPRRENKSLVEIEQSSISINELRREK